MLIWLIIYTNGDNSILRIGTKMKTYDVLGKIKQKEQFDNKKITLYTNKKAWKANVTHSSTKGYVWMYVCMCLLYKKDTISPS